jgi:hypothetical protein
MQCGLKLVLVYLLCTAAFANADTYLVTTLRASPGQLESLLDEANVYRAGRDGNVVLMRHSQGDHWDLMLLQPAASAAAAPGKSQPDFDLLVDFQMSFLAHSETPFSDLKAQAAGAGLFHIEMFHALAGKKAALIDQRHRENQYLQQTGQTPNAVFVTRLGSDVDVFTLGFHKNMAALDAGPTVSAARAEQIAKQAGFKNRADLGFYLRTLLTSHHDTLAVPVGG